MNGSGAWTGGSEVWLGEAEGLFSPRGIFRVHARSLQHTSQETPRKQGVMGACSAVGGRGWREPKADRQLLSANVVSYSFFRCCQHCFFFLSLSLSLPSFSILSPSTLMSVDLSACLQSLSLSLSLSLSPLSPPLL